MTTPNMDFETVSEAGYVWNETTQKYESPPGSKQGKKGLSEVGAAVYSEHPSTGVLTFSYDLKGWRGIHKRRWRPGLPNPQDLFDYLAAGLPIEAHNVMFERLIWENVCVPKYGWPSLEPYVGQLRCSMATARVNAYPGALGNLSTVLALPIPKDAEGKRLLDKFSVPRNPTKTDARRWILPPWSRPEPPPGAFAADAKGQRAAAAYAARCAADDADYDHLQRYCDTDLDAESGASERMTPMSGAELYFWLIDQEVNWRGIGVDMDGVRACTTILGLALEQYGEEYRQITGLNPTQLEATKGWLSGRGFYVSSLDADHVEEALKLAPAHPPGGTDPVRRVLEIRSLIGSASVKKLYAMARQVSRDGRLRNLIVHHGARTGRPTGEGPQPLNLPKAGPDLYWCGVTVEGVPKRPGCGRPFRAKSDGCPWCGAGAVDLRKSKWSAAAVDHALEIMAHGSLELVEWYFGDALLTISGCIRGLFVAGPGKELIASDYSAIEAVVTAELAGEQWRVQAFREGVDIYLAGASKITGTPLEVYAEYKRVHGENHPDRADIGKISELACFTPQTQVLTDAGYVALGDITLAHRLWDGVEWVTHQGLVAKGVREVTRLDGVEMTPTHKIICDGSWREAKQLVSSPRLKRLALASGSENLPSWARQPTFGSEVRRFNAVVAGRRMLSALRTSTRAKARDVKLARSRPPGRLARTTGNTRMSFRTTNTAVAYSTELRRVSPGVTRLKGMQTTGFVASLCTPYSTTGAYSSPTSSLCRDGTSRILNSTASKQTATMSQEISGSSRKLLTKAIGGQCKSSNRNLTNLKPVFDIAHAGPRNRFTIRTNSGHLIVHNCGFGGWIGAYIQFGSTETEDVIKQQILAWRKASPRIVELWGGQSRGLPWGRGADAQRPERFGYEGAAVSAIEQPGTVFAYSAQWGLLSAPATDCDGLPGVWFFMRGDALIIRLLSGRELTYQSPRLSKAARPYAAAWELAITYMTWNTNPKYGPPQQWVPMSTFGARLAENVVQGTAHDIQRHGIILLRLAGYPLVLGVYDEDVVEVPAGTGSIEQVEQIMATMPPWAHGWPIRASGGWRGRRYRKG